MRKKGIIAIILLLASSIMAFAQPNIEVFTESKTLPDGNVQLTFTMNIEAGWYVYGANTVKGGPMPASLDLEASKDYELVGALQNGEQHHYKIDPGFKVEVEYFENSAKFIQIIKPLKETFKVEGLLNYQSCDGLECILNESEISEKIKTSLSVSNTQVASNEEVTPIIAEETASEKEETSLMRFLLVALLAGLAGVVTPCVFPMIPMTVGFLIGGSSSNKGGRLKGLIFGLSIVLIYTLLGLIVSLFQSTAATDAIGTHWIPNLIFALLFIVFAVSFLGAFEITLPNGLANKADQRADKGGYIAAFFVAVAMVIVSFSCTGPFVGSILAAAVMDGVALKPILGMAVFGAAFSLPFVLLSFFPGFMKKLPKSGGWLNVVKVVFAFVMLAFAMKFLYNIDAYFSWGIITRTGFLVIWITLALLLGMYFLGMYRTSHDSPCEGIGWVRMIAAIASFAFALYLVPGLFGAPLKTVSGLIPAMDDSVFSISNTSNGTNSESASGYSSIESYTNLDEAITISSQSHKPIFVSFKSHTCSVCKVMESTVLNDSEILSKLQNDFVVANLYVDDKTPDEEFKTLGRRYRNIEMTMFSSASQPLYAIIDASSNILAGPVGSCSKEEFLEFLNY
ncbi:MAG: thioredoxin family protein [Bacteroidales bacterium]|nr:thioredoxin family protein [Bacteroidales bacterium]